MPTIQPRRPFSRSINVQVVISTFYTDGLPSQYALVDAAKAAGIQLFVLSQIGAPTEGTSEGFLGIKNKCAGEPTMQSSVDKLDLKRSHGL